MKCHHTTPHITTPHATHACQTSPHRGGGAETSAKGALDEAVVDGPAVALLLLERLHAHNQGSGLRVEGSGFRVQGAGFRVQGSGFRVSDLLAGQVRRGVAVRDIVPMVHVPHAVPGVRRQRFLDPEP